MIKQSSIVRISPEARKKIKIKALQSGHKTIINYVDTLSDLPVKLVMDYKNLTKK